jgi:DNA-binding response OmpR family regulator
MSNEKRVLVIDGHLEMLDFLRSVLELTVENCRVVGVPTAGDGAKALKGNSFKLMIADIGLPGIGGSGLVHHAKRLWPEMQVILISDQDSESNRREAETLNAFRYYPRPVDSDALIYSVYKVLHDPREPQDDDQRSKLPRIDRQVKRGSPELQARLEALRLDTGARQALLANLSGDVLISTKGFGEMDLLDKVDSVADNVRASVQLGLKLGNINPYSIQYLSGEEYELYTANLMPNHWLALLFEIQAHRGKMGTIWFFTQKAIPELEALVEQVDQNRPKIDEVVPATKKAQIGDKEPVTGEPKSESELAPRSEQEAAQPKEEIEHKPAKHLVQVEDEAEDEKDEFDLFWDEALENDQVEDAATSGVSYEEALRLGLIPGEVELPEDEYQDEGH